jgi:hypothetical protein
MIGDLESCNVLGDKLCTTHNQDGRLCRKQAVDEWDRLRLEHEDALLQIRRLKQALYDECTGQSCGAVDCEGGYRNCVGCDRRAKMAYGPDWGKSEKREVLMKNAEFYVEPLPKDWDGSPKGCWDQHPLTREICQLKPDGHTVHKRDDASGKQLLCWVRS